MRKRCLDWRSSLSGVIMLLGYVISPLGLYSLYYLFTRWEKSAGFLATAYGLLGMIIGFAYCVIVLVFQLR